MLDCPRSNVDFIKSIFFSIVSPCNIGKPVGPCQIDVEQEVNKASVEEQNSPCMKFLKSILAHCSDRHMSHFYSEANCQQMCGKGFQDFRAYCLHGFFLSPSIRYQTLDRSVKSPLRVNPQLKISSYRCYFQNLLFARGCGFQTSV